MFLLTLIKIRFKVNLLCLQIADLVTFQLELEQELEVRCLTPVMMNHTQTIHELRR